jgi:hypothetical protein
MVHRIRAQRMHHLTATKYRHFRGISTGWKYARALRAYDPAIHEPDATLAERVGEVWPQQSRS